MITVSVYRNDSATLVAQITRYFELITTRVLGDVGALSIRMRAADLSGWTPYPDMRIAPILIAPDGRRHLIGVYLLRGVSEQLIGSTQYVTLLALDACDLLTRRIVAWPAGSSQSNKSGAADNVMRAFVREQLGSTAGSARDITAYGVSIEPDLGLAGSIEIGAAWRRLSDVLDSVADAARATNNQLIVYDMTPQSDGWSVQFQARLNGWRDRRRTGASPLWIGRESGMVIEAERLSDRRGSANIVYGGGRGEGISREIITVSDSTELGQSPIARSEAFFDGASTETTTALTAGARRRLAQLAPANKFSARLQESSRLRYGSDIVLGDLLTLSVIGEYDVLVRSVRILSRGNEETVEIGLETLT